MLNRARCAKTLAGAVAAGWMALGVLGATADRPISWLRPGAGNLEREMNVQASRGLRFASASDGLPSCAVLVMQAPEKAGGAAEYRVVSDKDLSGALDRLVEQGFVPRGSARGLGLRHDVIFERITPAAAGGAWRLVEFEKLEDLPSVLRVAAPRDSAPRCSCVRRTAVGLACQSGACCWLRRRPAPCRSTCRCMRRVGGTSTI